MKISRILTQSRRVEPVRLPYTPPPHASSPPTGGFPPSEIISPEVFNSPKSIENYRWTIRARLNCDRQPHKSEGVNYVCGSNGRSVQEAWSEFVYSMVKILPKFTGTYANTYELIAIEKHGRVSQLYPDGIPQFPSKYVFSKNKEGILGKDDEIFNGLPRSRTAFRLPIKPKTPH